MTFFERRRRLLLGLSDASSEVIYWTVTHNYTHVTSNNELYSLENGSSYAAYLTADEGYEISSITIMMNDVDITDDCDIAEGDGQFTIPRVTGHIVITAIATEIVEAGQHTLTIYKTTGSSVTVNGTSAGSGDVFNFEDGANVKIFASSMSDLWTIDNITVTGDDYEKIYEPDKVITNQYTSTCTAEFVIDRDMVARISTSSGGTA